MLGLDLEHYRGPLYVGGDDTNAVQWSSQALTTYPVHDTTPDGLSHDLASCYGSQIRAWYVQAASALWTSAKVWLWGSSGWGHWEDALVAATPNIDSSVVAWDTISTHRAHSLGELANGTAVACVLHEGRYSGVTEGPTLWRNLIGMVAFAERLGRYDVADNSRPIYADAWFRAQNGDDASETFIPDCRAAAQAYGADGIVLSAIVNDSGDQALLTSRLGGPWAITEETPTTNGLSPGGVFIMRRRTRRGDDEHAPTNAPGGRTWF